MSIHLSQHQRDLDARSGQRLTLITDFAATHKPANTAFVLGMWSRTLPQGSETNVPRTLLSRNSGGSGGNDAYIRYAANSATSLEFVFRNGNTLLANNHTVAAPPAGTPFLFLLIQTASHCHLVTCAPGGTPAVSSVAATGLYSTNLTSNGGIMHRIGVMGSTARHAMGDVEGFFFAHGAFPETAGAPDTALIQNIANGAQDVMTLAGQLTGGDLRVYHPMRHRGDYIDLTGNYRDLRANTDGNIGENPDTGRFLYSGGYLRPGALRPTDVGHWVSPLRFLTHGDIATATATIRAEGGSYHGISPAAIEARLVREDGTAHVDWTVVDAAPAGGTWASHDFLNVAATPGFLELHFRAVDGSGTPISETIPSKGLRGTGFAFHAQQCQSQGMYHWQNTQGQAEPLDAGIRFTTTQITGEIGAPVVVETLHSSSNGPTRNRAAGIGWAANEINAAFPGYPIQMATVGESGQPPVLWDAGNTYADRWAKLGAYYGINQPNPQFLHFGHSSNSGLTEADYVARGLEGPVAECEAALGPISKILLAPTARYSGAGTGPNYDQVSRGRDAIWTYFKSEPRAYHLGSFAVVLTGNETGSDPHPKGDSTGQGRGGSLLGLGVLAAQGAIAGPAAITGKTAAGTNVTLSLGPVNA